MKITVVIPVRNSARVIEKALHSVWMQTHDDIQLVVMDGASTDGTLEILERHREKIDVLKSAKDLSSTDAINKSLEHVTGELVTILCADDAFSSPTVLAEVAERLHKNPEFDVLTGAIRVFDPAGLVPGSISISDPAHLAKRMSVHLGGTFFRTEILRERPFDLRMKVADDYEFMAYLVKVKKAKFSLSDTVIVDFALGGHSHKVENDFAVAKDCLYIRRKYFSLWNAIPLYLRDLSIAILRSCGFRPLTWTRKAVRFISTSSAF